MITIKLIHKTMLLLALIANFCYGQTAYITNNNDNSITVINVATDTVTTVIPMTYPPFGVSASNDGTKVYFSSLNTISTLNTATNSISDLIIPGYDHDFYSIVASPDGSTVYVGAAGDTIVRIINTITNTMTDSFAVGQSPYGLCTSPDGSKVYSANVYSGTITIVNASSNTISNTIPVNAGPWGVVVSPDGTKLFITNEYVNTVTVMNTVSDSILNVIPVGAGPIGITITPNGNKVYVANTFDNTVSVINTLTNAVSKIIAVGPHPYGISITPDGNKVYVVNENFGNSGTISVINTATDSVTATIIVGNGPIAIGNFISPYVQTNTTSIGTEEIESSDILVFPNPTNGNFTVTFPNENAEIKIINALGQTILNDKSKEFKININLSLNGVYFLYIRTNDRSFVQKVVVNSELK